jgi:colicin import membrane protein
VTAEAQGAELLLRGVSPPASSFVGPGLFSVLVHSLLLGALLFSSMLRPPPLLHSQTIHVKLARLGTPRSEKLLPVRDTPPPPPAAVPVPIATNPAPAPTVKPIPKPPSKGPVEKTKTNEETVRDTLARLQQQTTERPGQRDGFAFGNADQTEGDLYWARVVDRVKRFYTVPNTIPLAERARLVASVEVAIDRDGTILEIHTVKGSGNPTFDRAIEAAVHRCQAFPAPPPDLAKTARAGVTLEFHAAEM